VKVEEAQRQLQAVREKRLELSECLARPAKKAVSRSGQEIVH
jgi:hypothetical protein